MARTITRRKELAIRAALEADTAQIMRPVLLETTLLSLAGGALDCCSRGAGQSLMGALADQLPGATDVHMDARVLGFTLPASVLTGLASGPIASWRLHE